MDKSKTVNTEKDAPPDIDKIVRKIFKREEENISIAGQATHTILRSYLECFITAHTYRDIDDYPSIFSDVISPVVMVLGFIVCNFRRAIRDTMWKSLMDKNEKIRKVIDYEREEVILKYINNKRSNQALTLKDLWYTILPASLRIDKLLETDKLKNGQDNVVSLINALKISTQKHNMWFSICILKEITTTDPSEKSSRTFINRQMFSFIKNGHIIFDKISNAIPYSDGIYCSIYEYIFDKLKNDISLSLVYTQLIKLRLHETKIPEHKVVGYIHESVRKELERKEIELAERERKKKYTTFSPVLCFMENGDHTKFNQQYLKEFASAKNLSHHTLTIERWMFYLICKYPDWHIIYKILYNESVSEKLQIDNSYVRATPFDEDMINTVLYMKRIITRYKSDPAYKLWLDKYTMSKYSYLKHVQKFCVDIFDIDIFKGAESTVFDNIDTFICALVKYMIAILPNESCTKLWQCIFDESENGEECPNNIKTWSHSHAKEKKSEQDNIDENIIAFVIECAFKTKDGYRQ
jgi:hypothetical protein